MADKPEKATYKRMAFERWRERGGYVAAAFDDLLGAAQSLGGRPGMTGTLTVRYRRPTPLHKELRDAERANADANGEGSPG